MEEVPEMRHCHQGSYASVLMSKWMLSVFIFGHKTIQKRDKSFHSSGEAPFCGCVYTQINDNIKNAISLNQ